MSIHTQISNINLAPRRSATEYKELYSEIQDLAKSEDNKEHDDIFRSGTVLIRSTEDQEFVSLGYRRDESTIGEKLSVYQYQLTDKGESFAHTTGLHAQKTDNGRYIRFRHVVEIDGKSGCESEQILLVDTKTDTLFQELPQK